MQCDGSNGDRFIVASKLELDEYMKGKHLQSMGVKEQSWQLLHEATAHWLG